MKHARSAGVLLHPTSLPSPYGIGDLGDGAMAFVDWLHDAGCTRWQILPLVPPGGGGSPYSSPSANAVNPLLLDLEDLVKRGLLSRHDVDARSGGHFDPDFVEWRRVVPYKQALVERAAARFADSAEGKVAIDAFVADNAWAPDDALFVALKDSTADAAWWTWERALAGRDPAALAGARERLRDPIARRLAAQTLVDLQWQKLRAHCARRGVQIIGDMPIYVDGDSVDVWTNQHLFQLDDGGRARAVSGVPPDAFSEVGQLWGSPLYDWSTMARENFSWWTARLRRALSLTDIVRIDHFRAFAGYWEIPSDAVDARAGRWVKGPGRALFDAMSSSIGTLPVIAEDLGVITTDVVELRDGVGLPGMKILQFAFGDDADNHYLPHNHTPQSVVYTGTHDNDTTLGWWRASSEKVRDHARRYFSCDGSDIVYDLIRAAYASCAHTAIVPMQDVLALDSGARMNTPGLADGNWAWRVRVEAFHANLARRLRTYAELYDRAPRDSKPVKAPTY